MDLKKEQDLETLLAKLRSGLPIGPLVECIGRGSVKMGHDGVLCVVTPKAKFLLETSGERVDACVAVVRMAARSLAGLGFDTYSLPVGAEGSLIVRHDWYGRNTVVVHHEGDYDERWFAELEGSIEFWLSCWEREDGEALAVGMLRNHPRGPGLLYLANGWADIG